MEKQDLKNLLENIYHLLAEEAPPPTAELPRGTVTPTVSPGTDAQSQTSFYDRSAQPPTLPPVGPWNNGWSGAAVVWPPPTSAVPPAGPGGMWISWTLDGGQILYYYVYPENQSGFFPAWGWYGSDYGFIQEVPDWGDGAS